MAARSSFLATTGGFFLRIHAATAMTKNRVTPKPGKNQALAFC
jgi:hypothetical protein